MPSTKVSLLWFSRYLWFTLGIFVIFAVTFSVYVRSEKRIDQAYEARLRSLQLINQLRDSSDALTIQSRDYLVTGDPAGRERFQQILDVRDGLRPRPKDLQEHLWEQPGDVVMSAAAPLLVLMSQAGFSGEEMRLLNQAKLASDALAAIELGAMNTINAYSAVNPGRRTAGEMLLFDASYQQAKALIMRPIFAVQRSVEQRTAVAVQRAAQQANGLRGLFMLLGGLMLFTLFSARHSLKNILGGSVAELHQRIERLGSGDFVLPAVVTRGHEHSVIGWLAQAQLQLAKGYEQNLQAQQQVSAAQQRFRDIVDTADGIVWEADALTFQYTFISQKAERMLGYSIAEWQQPGFWVAHIHPDDQDWAPAYCAACIGRLEPHDVEYRFIAQDGRTLWLHDSVTVVAENAAPRWLRGLTVDVTERKQVEQELRIAAVAFESQEGIMVANIKHEILRVNSAFTRITGYSAAEVQGKSPLLLSSSRHGPEFYAEMWGSINTHGMWAGEIWNKRKNGEVYPQYLTLNAVSNAAGEISHYVGTFSDITLRKAAMEEIHQLAFYDGLTSLPNRRLLLDRLDQALTAKQRSGKEGALLFIDLDNFKQLNDTWGHAVGDLLLQQVAQRLLTCVRGHDTVARLGGDEFVVMLEGLSEDPLCAAEQAQRIGEKILSCFADTFHLDGREYQTTASIGAALFNEPQTTVDEVLREADISMYAAKSAGRNALCFFDPAMQEVINQRAIMQGELLKAFLEKQFVLHYQMQCDQSGQAVGAEALVRWQHPQRGLIPPGEFIPLAEESGLILLIGYWVLTSACEQLALWAQTPHTAELSLSVNVSAKQFSVPTYVDEVTTLLKYTGINPAKLKLELTESLLLDNTEAIISKMLALKAVGVSFSMDDFGTGYSSLSYLKRLPLDQLKIDRSFVRDVLTDSNDAVIAKTIIVLAHSLGLQVIAEGVESAEQLAFLAHAGCQLYQGFWFSRPLPLLAFEQLIKAAPTNIAPVGAAHLSSVLPSRPDLGPLSS